MRPWHRRKRRAIPLLIVVLALLSLVVFVGDWKRDFTSHRAEISDAASDPRLKPLILELSARESIRVIRRAASRIRGWEYVGDVGHGNSTQILFVRTSRLWRIEDDVTLRVEDRGNRCILTGESVSRLELGDLGRNPRNLRRIVDEIRIVLQDTDPR